MREDYDDSQDFDYKSGDDRYEYSDCSDDSEYYEKSTKSRKRKMEKTEEGPKVEKRKTKKAKIKKKEFIKTAKKDNTGDAISSEESESDENESMSQKKKKKKIVSMKRRLGDSDETAESSKESDTVKGKKRVKKNKVRETESENIYEEQKSKGVKKDQNLKTTSESLSTKSERLMEIKNMKSKKEEITKKVRNESKELTSVNVKTKIVKGKRGGVLAGKKKRKTNIANESSETLSVDSNSKNQGDKKDVEKTGNKSVDCDEDRTSKCEVENETVDLYEGTGISVDVKMFKNVDPEEEKAVESKHAKSGKNETLIQEGDIFDDSINNEEEIEIS